MNRPKEIDEAIKYITYLGLLYPNHYKSWNMILAYIKHLESFQQEVMDKEKRNMDDGR